MAELKASLDPDSAPWAVWRFFDGLSDEEQRLRWDRLVAFHLVVMLFLRAYGYPMQRPSPKQVRAVVREVRNPEVVANLRTWLRRHGVRRSATRLLRRPARLTERGRLANRAYPGRGSADSRTGPTRRPGSAGRDSHPITEIFSPLN